MPEQVSGDGCHSLDTRVTQHSSACVLEAYTLVEGETMLVLSWRCCPAAASFSTRRLQQFILDRICRFEATHKKETCALVDLSVPLNTFHSKCLAERKMQVRSASLQFTTSIQHCYHRCKLSGNVTHTFSPSPFQNKSAVAVAPTVHAVQHPQQLTEMLEFRAANNNAHLTTTSQLNSKTHA